MAKLGNAMWMIIGLTHKEFIGEIKTASERKYDI
jgi:hypothetical protein